LDEPGFLRGLPRPLAEYVLPKLIENPWSGSFSIFSDLATFVEKIGLIVAAK
jgi:hypothetical protein